ncbi:MAG: MFS transporter [Chloroflexi bacterium]|nr:MFS transporter [Chloroflexota bacterium]
MHRQDARPSLLVGLSAATIFMVLTASFMIGPLLVELSEEFNTSIAVAGQLATVTAFLWAFSGPSSGPFSDTYGRKPVVLLGLFIMALSTLGAALSTSYGMMLFFRLLTGVGGGMVPPTLMATLGDFVPRERRGRSIGVAQGIASLGPVLAVPLLAVEADFLGWRSAFYTVAGGLAFLLVLLSFIFPGGSPATTARLQFHRRILQAFGQGEPRLIVAANLLTRAGFTVVSTYGAAFLMRSYGLTLGQVAVPFSIIMLGSTGGSLMGGLLADRPRALPLAATVVALGGWAAVALFQLPLALWLSMVLGALFNMALQGPFPLSLKVLTELSSESRGTMTGLIALSNQSGVMLGAALGGLILGLGGYLGLGYLCLSASVLSGVFFLFLHLRLSRRVPRGPASP